MRPRSAALFGSASLLAVALICSGCTQPSGAAAGDAVKRTPVPVAASGQPVAAPKPASGLSQPDPASLPEGSVYRNPRSNRDEIVLADVRHTAVLIGDSQSEPEGSWPRSALAALGYTVYYAGKSGTGFVGSNGSTGNYIDALVNGDWMLPYGSPPLIVVQGGGNDARQGADDARITENANRLLDALRTRYPGSRLLMIGTLSRGEANGGGRRAEVDALLGRIAHKADIPFVSVGDWITRYGAEGDLVDGVHLAAPGHRKLAAVLARRLSELGLADDVTESGLS
ncbi:SGNH/GDSL hydrolase family protein [Arthrobacter cupressi]|uniref:Acyl-CoA thioesterase-1 n=1 Tax=Arthrobacter cupressi TaxID=1045773 RepID=A0A1G8PES2_9MICC|nr:SGNH/GDSL hydrolase family protein [Arthrobacter cupressi]NYD76817.1 acyl-CoA thioesterase-1 [Arthrobacter cupressi]SDI90952.1 acyl-CoA thioesterase-1 [Arthrobacter cupressi]